MFSTKNLVTFVAVVSVSATLQASAVNAPLTEYQLMSTQEIDQHKQTMSTLNSDERIAYRNAEYAKLKARAASEGYELSDTPPWDASAATSKVAVEQAGNVDGAADATMQSEANLALSMKGKAKINANTESELISEQRKALRQRFDDFIATRDARLKAEAEERRKQQEAQMQQYRAQMAQQQARYRQMRQVSPYEQPFPRYQQQPAPAIRYQQPVQQPQAVQQTR